MIRVLLNTLDCRREVQVPREVHVLNTKFMCHVENVIIEKHVWRIHRGYNKPRDLLRPIYLEFLPSEFAVFGFFGPCFYFLGHFVNASVFVP